MEILDDEECIKATPPKLQFFEVELRESQDSKRGSQVPDKSQSILAD